MACGQPAAPPSTLAARTSLLAPRRACSQPRASRLTSARAGSSSSEHGRGRVSAFAPSASTLGAFPAGSPPRRARAALSARLPRRARSVAGAPASTRGALARRLAPRRARSELLSAGSASGERAGSPAGWFGPGRARSKLLPTGSPSCSQARRPARGLAFLASGLARLRARSQGWQHVLILRRAGSRPSEHPRVFAEPARDPARALIFAPAGSPPREQPRADSARARRGAGVLGFGYTTTGIEGRASLIVAPDQLQAVPVGVDGQDQGAHDDPQERRDVDEKHAQVHHVGQAVGPPHPAGGVDPDGRGHAHHQ